MRPWRHFLLLASSGLSRSQLKRKKPPQQSFHSYSLPESNTANSRCQLISKVSRVSLFCINVAGAGEVTVLNQQNVSLLRKTLFASAYAAHLARRAADYRGVLDGAA